MSDAARSPEAKIGSLESIQEVELMLLSGANAIQRLISERNALRSRADAQERELTRLRHHVTLIHDSYRRLTSEYVTQFQLLERAVGNFVRETRPGDTGQAEPKSA
jgi:hypothetical protein